MPALSADVFTEYRPLLFSIAYRMLSSAVEAEDAVQETFLRWQTAAEAEVRSPRAYLSAVVTRLCIDHLRSARAQRETYVGPWLPEPVLREPVADTADHAALSESLSMAFLVLLESLNPTERAVFLLREVFDYEYAEVANIVGKSEANCRQIARRARDYVTARRPRFEPSRERKEQLTQQFARTCRAGDLTGLIALLDEDITLWSDGGGKALAALNPIYGADKVARFLLGIVRKAADGMQSHFAEVNGEPGIVTLRDGAIYSVTSLDIADGRITAVRIMRNPDKLRRIEGEVLGC